MRLRAVQPRRVDSPLPSSFQSAAVDLRDDGITEAEARKRLSSYVVVRIDKSLPAIDGQGNLVPSSWDKSSHMIQREISQQEAKQSVRELSRETGCVSDKKSELSSALQRQLEHAHTRLENMESDRRYIYTLAQLDWKFKRVEAPREYRGRQDKHVSKDRKRDKERHGSKTKKERVSVMAYFKREPSDNENCLKMYIRQQRDKTRDESRLSSSARIGRHQLSTSPTSTSSASSFGSFPSKDSNGNLTPNSSVDDTSPRRHYEEGRGRSRYRQSRNGEPFKIAVARRDSVGRQDCIPPPMPDPTRPEPKPAMKSPRRMEQGMARSRSARDSSRQVRFAQSPLEEQKVSFHHAPYYSPSGKDVIKQQRDRLGRASLADEPASSPATRHTYREEPLRQYHKVGDEEFRVSEANSIVWRKQDAQRYMNDRRRF